MIFHWSKCLRGIDSIEMAVGVGMKAIGVETVAVKKFSELMVEKGSTGFDEYFSEDEKQHCWASSRALTKFAGLFAAKGALLKALPALKRGGIDFVQMQIEHDRRGSPSFKLEGESLEKVKRAGVHNVHVSISHDEEGAVAFVVVS